MPGYTKRAKRRCEKYYSVAYVYVSNGERDFDKIGCNECKCSKHCAEGYKLCIARKFHMITPENK